MFLLRPFLPREAKLRLRQQRLDKKAYEHALWALKIPDISVALLRAVDGRNPGRGMRFSPKPPVTWRLGRQSPLGRWYTNGLVEWDGEQVWVRGETGRRGEWTPTSGGLLPGFDPVEVFEAGVRPAPSGECPDRLAAIVTVGLSGHHRHLVYFLDEESRWLGWLPMLGLDEEYFVNLAEAAGVAYRSYALTLAKFSSLRLTPHTFCEALFPRSARRIRLTSEEFAITDDWFAEQLRWR